MNASTENTVSIDDRAIQLRFHGPTNYRGSRIIASGFVTFTALSGGKPTRLTYSWDDALDSKENYIAAAQAWIDENLHSESEYVAGYRLKSQAIRYGKDTLMSWEVTFKADK